MQGEATDTKVGDPVATIFTPTLAEPSAIATRRPPSNGVGEALGAAATAAAGVSVLVTSEQIDQLVAGIVAAQLAFESITKNKTADVQSRREGAKGYSYRYADLGEVLSVVRPSLAENGVAVMQFPFNGRDSLTIATVLAHSPSGQWMRNDFRLSKAGAGDDPQAIKSLSTYARRIALEGILGVAPEDEDDDAARALPKGPAVQMPQRASANGNGHGHHAPGTAGTRSPAVSQDPPAPSGGGIGHFSSCQTPHASGRSAAVAGTAVNRGTVPVRSGAQSVSTGIVIPPSGLADQGGNGSGTWSEQQRLDPASTAGSASRQTSWNSTTSEASSDSRSGAQSSEPTTRSEPRSTSALSGAPTATSSGTTVRGSQSAGGTATDGNLLIARLEKKRASNDSLYWVVELSNKQQALTFDTKIGERLEEWFKAHTPIQEMTTATRGGRPHIDEITARVS